MYVSDPGGAYVRDVIMPGSRGNCTQLEARYAERLNNDHVFHAIAKSAGDTF